MKINLYREIELKVKSLELACTFSDRFKNTDQLFIIADSIFEWLTTKKEAK